MSRLAALAALAALVAACSSGSGPSVVTADGLSCDRDQTSLEAKDTIERIGGLVTPDYTVRFTESTRVGVVALVDAHADRAFDDLHTAYGVSIVARDDHDRAVGRTTDFAQVRRLVDDACR